MASKGQLSLYKPEYDRQVLELCLLGKKDEEIAQYFGVVPSTFYLWKKEFPSFSEAIKDGKERADNRVVSALRQRAEGMEVEEEHVTIDPDGKKTIKIVKRKLPPDPTSMIYWLNNRQRANWKNRTAIDPLDNNGNSITLNVTNYDPPKEKKKSKKNGNPDTV